MRLVIAGVLTLVIYLMTCSYGNEKEEAPKVKEKDVPCHYFMFIQEDFMLYSLPMYNFYPLYPIQEDKDCTPTQTFPNV